MSANVAPEIQAPPQPQPQRRKLDIAVLRVREQLAKHPEYSSVECLVALCVALHMRRQAPDGFYRCTLRQGDSGVLVKEVRAGRRTIQRALGKLCASGGIFTAVPRYGQIGRLANDYVLIEAPKAYHAQRTEGGAEVLEHTPRRPTGAERQAADALCGDYAAWYQECRGVPYEPCPLDTRHALLLVREYDTPQLREYLAVLLYSWLHKSNDQELQETYRLPEAHKARLLYQARPYVKLMDQDWRKRRDQAVPQELLT